MLRYDKTHYLTVYMANMFHVPLLRLYYKKSEFRAISIVTLLGNVSMEMSKNLLDLLSLYISASLVLIYIFIIFNKLNSI